MRYILFSLIFVAFIVIPFIGVSQAEAAQECPHLSRSLYLGREGDDVSSLQLFLRSTGDFTYPEITGYFGPVTEQAVERFQCREMELCSGSPETNGYGVVGPQTRAAIYDVCEKDGESDTEGEEGGQEDGGENEEEEGNEDEDDGATDAASTCTFAGKTIPDGGVVLAYNVRYATSDLQCIGEFRFCEDGELSGSYPYDTCSVSDGTEGGNPNGNDDPPPLDTDVFENYQCEFNGRALDHGASVVAYEAAEARSCIGEIRTCNFGQLSGSYQYEDCEIIVGGDEDENDEDEDEGNGENENEEGENVVPAPVVNGYDFCRLAGGHITEGSGGTGCMYGGVFFSSNGTSISSNLPVSDFLSCLYSNGRIALAPGGVRVCYAQSSDGVYNDQAIGGINPDLPITDYYTCVLAGGLPGEGENNSGTRPSGRWCANVPDDLVYPLPSATGVSLHVDERTQLASIIEAVRRILDLLEGN